MSVGIGGATANDLDREQAEIDRLYEWVKTLPFLERLAYKGWLHYAQGGVNSARREIKYGWQRKSMDRYHTKRGRENAAIDQYKISKPPVRL
jgi:hypothetical protein